MTIVQTFYFVSFNRGFIQYASVYAQNKDKALAILTQPPCPNTQIWVSVSEEDYLNLLNQEA